MYHKQSHTVLTSFHQWILIPALLCSILFQNCQSRLSILEEEVPSAVSSGLELPPSVLAHESSAHDVPPRPPISVLSFPVHRSVFTAFSSDPPCPPVILTSSSSRSRKQPSDAKNIFPQFFPSSSGVFVRFRVQDGAWQAWVAPDFSTATPQRLLPVISSTAISSQLIWLQGQSFGTTRARVHVLPSSATLNGRSCVYLGKLGLLGGMPKREACEESEEAQAAKKQRLINQLNPAILPLPEQPLPNAPDDPLPLVCGDHRAFGAQAWHDYFGVEVEEVPLPANIEELLEEKAPFLLEDETTNQRVRDNHLLTLIPSHIKFPDGRRVAFTLDKLGELILANYDGHMDAFQGNINSELGKKSHGYLYYSKYLPLASRTEPLSTSSYWLLLSKTILADSRCKTCSEHEKLVSDLGADYRLPRALEAATSLLSHYARHRERLYAKNNSKGWRTHTRCSDTARNECSLFVGPFGRMGLIVYNNDYDFYRIRNSTFSGVACCRKL